MHSKSNLRQDLKAYGILIFIIGLLTILVGAAIHAYSSVEFLGKPFMMLGTCFVVGGIYAFGRALSLKTARHHNG